MYTPSALNATAYTGRSKRMAKHSNSIAGQRNSDTTPSSVAVAKKSPVGLEASAVLAVEPPSICHGISYTSREGET